MTPEDLGFDGGRLRRITDLTHGYVDQGRLPFATVQVARRGEVVTGEVLAGASSRVFDQAENRMHAARGLLEWVASA